MFDLIPFRRSKTGLTREPASIFDVESVFENFFNEALWPSLYAGSSKMRVDVREKDDEFIVEAELPGVKKEEIGIDLDEDLLTISVKRNEEIDEKNERYIRRERKYGMMSRSFSIANVDPEKATARLENGILTLVLPKKKPESKRLKKIEIK